MQKALVAAQAAFDAEGKAAIAAIFKRKKK